MNIKPLTSNVLLTFFFIAVFLVVAQTISSVFLFIPALLLSLYVYYLCFERIRINGANLLPVYLIALAIQMIHFYEEYLNEFCIALPTMINQDPYPINYWVGFNMIAYAIFISGGIVLLKHIKHLFIIPIFFTITGVFLNAFGHVGLSIYSGGYFPGLYTAILYIFLSIFLIKQIRRTLRNSVRE